MYLFWLFEKHNSLKNAHFGSLKIDFFLNALLLYDLLMWSWLGFRIGLLEITVHVTLIVEFSECSIFFFYILKQGNV